MTVKMSHFYAFIFNDFIAIGICLLLSITYVASLHVWKSPYGRDHPSTIKRRCVSVFIMSLLSPCILYLGINSEILRKVTLLELLGLRIRGLCQALIMPLFLTMILFLGPIAMKVNSGLAKLYLEPTYWISNLQNLIWLRNHVIGPFSEEFTFRSCMLPILLQHFSPLMCIVICPLLFGVAHVHHMYDRIKFDNTKFEIALKMACFEMAYTTLFGMYSTYILLRTGHFASTFIIHSFCNHMGFPNVMEILSYERNEKIFICILFILGFLMWCLLLNPLTEPRWYYNDYITIFF